MPRAKSRRRWRPCPTPHYTVMRRNRQNSTSPGNTIQHRRPSTSCKISTSRRDKRFSSHSLLNPHDVCERHAKLWSRLGVRVLRSVLGLQAMDICDTWSGVLFKLHILCHRKRHPGIYA